MKTTGRSLFQTSGRVTQVEALTRGRSVCQLSRSSDETFFARKRDFSMFEMISAADLTAVSTDSESDS